MHRSTVLLGLAFAAPASLLLVACGGPSDEERYGDAFTEVAQPLTAELIDLGNAVGSANSSRQVGAALGRADEALETASAGFEDLDPPAGAADAQDDLLAAIADFEGEVGSARAVMRSGSTARQQRALEDFITESQAFAAELGEINRRLEDAGIPLGDPVTSGST